MNLDRLWTRWVARFVPSPARRALKRSLVGERATTAAIYNCYRLILGREPDPAGLAYFQELIDSRGVTLEELSLLFLSSTEFRHRNLFNSAPHTAVALADLGAFRMYVPPHDPVIGGKILDRKRYEPHVTAFLESRLRPGMTFVDVGANLGYFTLLAASRVGPEGRVIAFEPSPRNCELLARSIRKNRFGNVRLVPYAAAEGRDLYLYRGMGTNGTLTELGEREADDFAGQVVCATSLDEELRDLDRLDVMKIDVEGSEYKVLAGARRLIAARRPTIVSEFSPPFLEQVSGVPAKRYLEELVALGYELSVLDSDVEGRAVACGTDIERVVALFEAAGATHVDIVAEPPGRS